MSVTTARPRRNGAEKRFRCMRCGSIVPAILAVRCLAALLWRSWNFVAPDPAEATSPTTKSPAITHPNVHASVQPPSGAKVQSADHGSRLPHRHQRKRCGGSRKPAPGRAALERRTTVPRPYCCPPLEWNHRVGSLHSWQHSKPERGRSEQTEHSAARLRTSPARYVFCYASRPWRTRLMLGSHPAHMSSGGREFCRPITPVAAWFHR